VFLKVQIYALIFQYFEVFNYEISNYFLRFKGKGKVQPRTGHEGPEGGGDRYIARLSLTLWVDGGGWSTPRLGRFTLGIAAIPIVEEGGWTPGPVWTGAENLAPTGVGSPERPARSESLYRLSYHGPHFRHNKKAKCNAVVTFIQGDANVS